MHPCGGWGGVSQHQRVWVAGVVASCSPSAPKLHLFGLDLPGRSRRIVCRSSVFDFIKEREPQSWMQIRFLPCYTSTPIILHRIYIFHYGASFCKVVCLWLWIRPPPRGSSEADGSAVPLRAEIRPWLFINWFIYLSGCLVIRLPGKQLQFPCIIKDTIFLNRGPRCLRN